MAKTESTAVNNLIELTATATPLKPAPGDDLMFAEPAKRSASKPVSVPRMSATLTNAAPVEPLPRGRGAAGTQQNALTPPGVRITTAPPSRAVTIPPMPPVPTKSSTGLTPMSPPAVPPLRTSRPSLPPPTRQSAPIATQSPLVASTMVPPPTDPSYDSAPLAPIDLTDQSWFEESRAVDLVTGPVSESTWVGTVHVPKQATTAQWLGKLALPMGAMIVIGIFVGGYVAFDGEGGHKRTQKVAAAAAAVAPAGDLANTQPTTASGDLAKTEPATDGEPAAANAGEPTAANPATGDLAKPEPANPAPPAAATIPSDLATTATAPAKADPALTTPTVAPSAVPAAAAPTIADGKTVFVDVRLDSKPSGATVMLVDRGKTMFLGTTPISTALDPSRQYDVVFTYKDRPTVLEHLDPRTQSKLAVTLSRSGGTSPTTEVEAPKAIAKVEAPKTETPKAENKIEAPKAIAKEAPKAQAPKAETPKAEKKVEAPKAVAKVEAPKAETPKAETPKAETPKAETPKAEKKVEAPKAVAKVEAPTPKTEAPKAGSEGVLMVSSKPPCEIYVDGKATGLMTPQRALPLSAGTHKVTLVNSAEKIKKTLTVQITADQPTKLIQDLMAQ